MEVICVIRFQRLPTMKDGPFSCYLVDLQLSVLDWSVRFTAPTRINHKTCLFVQSFISHNYLNLFNISSAIYPVYVCYNNRNVNTVKLIGCICSVEYPVCDSEDLSTV